MGTSHLQLPKMTANLKSLEECNEILLPGIYSYKQSPHFLKGNPYVVTGYRVNFTYRQCLHSLLYWSNETLNIWTHFIGALWFMWLFYEDNVNYLPSHEASLKDHVIFSLFLVCSVACLLLSTGYHVFCCHSERCFNRWFSLDLTGICLGVNSFYVPSIYYGFYCHKTLQAVYTSLVVLFLICKTLMQLHPQYLTKSWHRWRLGSFTFMSIFGFVPAIHWVSVMMSYEPAVVTDFLPKVFVMYGIIALAFVIYISKVPERIFPGTFDYIGSSHQIWHVLVLVAFLFWHCAGRHFFVYRQSNPCPPHS